MGVFDTFQSEAYPYRYGVTLHIPLLCGGVPLDPKVRESWLRAKLKDTRSEAEIASMIVKTQAEFKLSEEEAIGKVATDGTLSGANGFKSDELGLYVEGRQVKAALKEAAMVAANEGKIQMDKWGDPRNAKGEKNLSLCKQVKGWFPEHVFVEDTAIHILRDGEYVTEASDVLTKFIHSPMGNSIGYVQYARDVDISFTVVTDHAFDERELAMIWLTGQRQGFGADRSQGYGVYEVTRWELEKPVV